MSGSEDSFVEDSTKIENASDYKQQGNDALKAGKYDVAMTHYEEGLKALEGCVDKHGDEFNDCQDSLNANLCLAAMKNGQWYTGIHSADKVLDNTIRAKRNDALDQKVRYRRGVCHLSVGNFDEAEQDLNQVVKADAANTEAKRRLQECKEGRAKAAKLEKQRFGNLFKDTSSLYADREAERLTKEKKEREEYAKDVLSKDITFEQWRERRRLEAEAKAKKDREAKKTTPSGAALSPNRSSPSKSSPSKDSPNKKSEASSPADVAGKGASSAKGKGESSGKGADVLELDEEDLKIIEETKKRGYCYFRKELTEEERKLKDTVHVPQKMAVEEERPSPSKKGVSDWNVSGTTYEEKDTTKWCISMLTNQLENSKCSASGLVVENIAAKGMAGDAQIMVVRGRVRHFFDFNLKLEFDLLDGDKKIGHAVWTIDSMSSENLDEFLNFKLLKWQTTPPLQYVDRLPTILNHLKDTLRAGVESFCKLYAEKH